MNAKTFEEELAMYGRAYVDGIPVYPCGLEECTEDEARAYIAKIREQYPHEKITRLEIKPEEDGNVSLDYGIAPPPFQRIRRITGYLVGDMGRWGNAKRAEERDRVKHTDKIGAI